MTITQQRKMHALFDRMVNNADPQWHDGEQVFRCQFCRSDMPRTEYARRSNPENHESDCVYVQSLKFLQKESLT